MLIFYSVAFLHSMELQMHISTLPISYIAQQYYHHQLHLSFVNWAGGTKHHRYHVSC